MESTGDSPVLRNRRSNSFFNTNPKSEQISKSEIFLENHDGWFICLVSYLRIIACFLTMMMTTIIWGFIMILLLPWPCQRTKQGNIYGHVTGRLLIQTLSKTPNKVNDLVWERVCVNCLFMWILGNPVKIEGSEYNNEKAIYISNHASPIDIFLMMWLTPIGTVGIAKKEIIWYPLFGQLYFLANHLRIDRSNPSSAIQSMKEAVGSVIKNNLSIVIFPEGTRSKNGRLLPFKKGFVHLAIQSGLPIVPMVLTGTHLAWRKGTLNVRPTPITVKYLPPITTENWTADKIDDYLELVHNVYVQNLPDSQKPVRC